MMYLIASYVPSYYGTDGGWTGDCKCDRSLINPTNQTFTIVVAARNNHFIFTRFLVHPHMSFLILLGF
jgi:hypothetical protein